MPTYDISAHGLLSDKAEDLYTNDPDSFNAHVVAAEFVFDLNGTSYTGDKKTIAEMILVYQVNYQLENDQESELYDRIVEGDRTYQFKDKVPLSPSAQQLAEKLKSDSQNEAEILNRVGNSKGVRNIPLW